MASEALAYSVDDRSILLPYYRRFLVDPLLPLLPRRLNPNTITHAGHLLNLVATVLLIALWPKRGWPFAVATVLLQLYCWCDNADGAHARRTNQCSPLGEFLDHGLDQLNTIYIGFLTCMALGASPFQWVVISFLIPGAAVVTYWEQASTGIFRVGLLNQIESLLVLSLALTASGIFGTAIFHETTLVSLFGPNVYGFDISLNTAMFSWVTITIVFGAIRAVVRVALLRGLPASAPILPYLVFAALVIEAAYIGAIGTVPAVVIATGATVFVGMRMLSSRLAHEQPRFEVQLVAASLVAGGVLGWCAFGGSLSPLFVAALVAVATLVHGAQAALAARENVQRLSTAPTTR